MLFIKLYVRTVRHDIEVKRKEYDQHEWKYIKKYVNSALFKHSKETGHLIDYENFEVIDKASYDLKLSY